MFVYSGLTGGLIYQLDGPEAGGAFGASASSAGDFNKDGTPDIVVGAPFNNAHGLLASGAVFVHSGADGTLLELFEGEQELAQFGGAVASAERINPNPYSDIILGSHAADTVYGVNSGMVKVMGFNPYLQSSASTLSASSFALLAIEVDFPSEAQFSEYRVLFGSNTPGSFVYGVEIPLTLDQKVIQTFFGNYFSILQTGLQGTLNQDGNAVATIGLFPGSASHMIGRTLHMAAIANNPGELPNFASIPVALEIVP